MNVKTVIKGNDSKMFSLQLCELVLELDLTFRHNILF